MKCYGRPILALAWLLAAPHTAVAQQPVNPIHPGFVPRDAQGQALHDNSRPLSSDVTCGACHDVAYINAHSTHHTDTVRASCVTCHVDGGRLEVAPEYLDAQGLVIRDRLRIGRPQSANCALCHGVIGLGNEVVRLPPDYMHVTAMAADSSTASAPLVRRSYDLTAGSGAIISSQQIARSWLNLQDKEQRRYPWDVHAARLVDCVACHYAPNNPERASKSEPVFVANDPRRMATADFLRRPDHRLVAADCRRCHRPLAVHDMIPYKERHLQLLACASCHASRMMGPALELVDATVVTAAGDPAVRYRGIDGDPARPLNASFMRGYAPVLLATQTAGRTQQLAPHNLVTRWSWVDAGGTEVPWSTVQRVYRQGERYLPVIVSALDRNRDGALDDSELRLRDAAEVEVVAARLRALGVRGPRIIGRMTSYPVVHGIVSRGQVAVDCSTCHSDSQSRLAASVSVARYLPGNVLPKVDLRPGVALGGTLERGASGTLILRRGEPPHGYYVFGRSRHGFTDLLGFWLFVVVLAAVIIHGATRIVLAHRRPTPTAHTVQRVYAFSVYTRLWHWLMALSITLLVLTGLVVHHAPHVELISLPLAVKLHNVVAFVLIANAFLSLFYHLASATIRRFIPSQAGLPHRLAAQLDFYLRGIFAGAPHPEVSPERRLNPLQQVTYLVLLNLILPLQVITGAMMLAVAHWPDVAASIGGLTIVAPMHNFGSWLLITFYTMHVYVITTGPSIGSNLAGMFTGYELIETHDSTTPSEGA